jgi:hypothetical protein
MPLLWPQHSCRSDSDRSCSAVDTPAAIAKFTLPEAAAAAEDTPAATATLLATAAPALTWLAPCQSQHPASVYTYGWSSIAQARGALRYCDRGSGVGCEAALLAQCQRPGHCRGPVHDCASNGPVHDGAANVDWRAHARSEEAARVPVDGLVHVVDAHHGESEGDESHSQREQHGSSLALVLLPRGFVEVCRLALAHQVEQRDRHHAKLAVQPKDMQPQGDPASAGRSPTYHPTCTGWMARFASPRASFGDL